MPMYYKKKTSKKLKKTKIFTLAFLNIDESRNLTILKYISHSNPNTPFSTSKLKTIISLYKNYKKRKKKNRKRKNKK
jgi:hypothetical protein